MSIKTTPKSILEPNTHALECNEFLEAMRFRHACKVFDAHKKIPQDHLDIIIESGRLTPSSFGLEPTRLLILRNNDIRQNLKPLCWDQAQITDCSEVVIYLSKIADMSHTSNYATQMFERKVGGSKPEEVRAKLKAYKDERYAGFLAKNGYVDSSSIYHWSAKQAYLMASSMMNCAAYLGIDSCAIEGFDKDDVEAFLGLDRAKEQVALLICFGYRISPPKHKAPRIAFNEFATIL
ncbi:NAD(P)H-dependent oxidoreductase [Helicobacter sp. T3_23-1056]